MSEITLAQALIEFNQSMVGRVLTVKTNAKGDRSKRAEEFMVKVTEVKVLQEGNPNIITEEVGGLLERKGTKRSLGGNTKIK